MNRDDYRTMIDRLPACPGISGRDLNPRFSVFVPFVSAAGEYHLLFEKRSPNIRQGGEICFPGGSKDEDLDKGPRDTALRETVEELGVGKDRIRIGGQADSVIASMGAVIDVYVGELLIDSTEECSINPDEVDEIFLVPVRFFLEHPPRTYELHLEIKPSYYNENGQEVVLFPVQELGLPEHYSRPWKGRNYSVLVYTWKGYTIWGMTARIVDSLLPYRASGER